MCVVDSDLFIKDFLKNLKWISILALLSNKLMAATLCLAACLQQHHSSP